MLATHTRIHKRGRNPVSLIQSISSARSFSYRYTFQAQINSLVDSSDYCTYEEFQKDAAFNP